jgi:hypothetical protein
MVEEATASGPADYGINCAHPTHFMNVLQGSWTRRVKLIRANASRLSHAELDEAEDLDDRDPEALGTEYAALRQGQPQINGSADAAGPMSVTFAPSRWRLAEAVLSGYLIEISGCPRNCQFGRPPTLRGGGAVRVGGGYLDAGSAVTERPVPGELPGRIQRLALRPSTLGRAGVAARGAGGVLRADVRTSLRTRAPECSTSRVAVTSASLPLPARARRRASASAAGRRRSSALYRRANSSNLAGSCPNQVRNSLVGATSFSHSSMGAVALATPRGQRRSTSTR